MLVYKQRYKPRTSREFTKSDLTVYDSAGNTALNALTVYGKSEVVDGSIVSAGEGWSVVDLGTLTWVLNSTYNVFIANVAQGTSEILSAVCDAYRNVNKTFNNLNNGEFNYGQQIRADGIRAIAVKNTAYSDPDVFKSAMSGVILAYPLYDPTQGNTIAIKTDNGTGIDGTMATFSTGTPLRGIPSGAKDVAEWDGTSGEITKNCNKVRLADLTWTENQNHSGGFASDLANGATGALPMVSSYPYDNTTYFVWSKFDRLADNTMYRTLESNAIYIKSTIYANNLAGFIASLGDAELVYELATPTTEQLTATENTSIAGLRTFAPNTHVQNNAGTDMTVDYTIRVPTV